MDYVIYKDEKIPITKIEKRVVVDPSEQEYLRYLNIKDAGIKSLDEIEGLFEAHISSLNLSDNELESLDGMEKLPELIYLDLENNNIGEIRNLENVIHLVRLNLDSNQVKKIENVSNLPNLVKLRLNGNQISEIENLDSLKELGSLDLSYNNISEIKGLDNLENLSMLYLWDNKIKKIQGFSTLKKLQEVHLGHNQIESISGIETIRYGAKVVLQANPIPKGQIDCFRYHYEIYEHERGDDMGDILFQLAMNGRIKGLQRLLFAYETEFEEIEKQIYENGENHNQVNLIDKTELYQLEIERLDSRGYNWKFIGERIEDEFTKMKNLALTFSETSNQASLMIKNLDSINPKTLDMEILKSCFLLQAKLFIKRAIFYHFNNKSKEKLAEMRPFFLSWDKRFGRYYFEPVLEGVEINWNHCESCGREIIDGKYCYNCLLDHPILAVPQDIKEEFKLPHVQESLKREQIFDSLLYKNTITGLQNEIELCFRDFNEEQRKRMRESFLAFLQAYLYFYKQEDHSRNLKLREFKDD